ncbi:MAG: non-ribosomal peptide synthetase, partial [Tumebacillaceae bacterium]
VRDMIAIYEAFATGHLSPLEELPVQYVDYTSWHNEWMQGEVLDEQLSYWKEQFSGTMPVLQLPTDRMRPAVQSHQGAKARFALSKQQLNRLTAFSQAQGVTLFMTLLATFQTLLSRYTGQEDIVVGTPIAGRNREEIEGLIGCFVNTLALRTDLSGVQTFQELLQQVKRVTLDAYTHQDLPFDRLIEELQPDRTLGQTPLFQVLFVLQNATVSASRIGDVAIAPYPIETGTAKFDLSLEMEETADGLNGTFEFATELFDETTISRMISHFQTLLDEMVTDPERNLFAYTMLTEAEKRELLVGEQETDRDKVKAACIHHLFEEQALQTPDLVAVRCGEEQLTYRELNGRANRVARLLQEHGVGPEMPVLLFLDRSIDLLVSLLGIWKAGGAFVPIDPMYPQERISLIAEDSQAPVWLTSSAVRERLPEGKASVICLDEARFSNEADEHPVSDVQPTNLAAMIYTSGSTGRPKAVMVEHRNLSSALTASLAHYRPAEGDVMPWIASVAFDIGMFEGLFSLLSGGTTVIITREQVLDMGLLVRELTGVTAFHAVPSLMRQIVQTVREQGMSPQAFAGVRK